MTSDANRPLGGLLREAMGPEPPDIDWAAGATKRAASLGRRRLISLAVGVAVAVAGVGSIAAVTLGGASGSTPHLTVAAASPTGEVDCAGLPVPIDRLSAPAGEERAATPTGRALADFLATHNGPAWPPATGWVLLADTGNETAYGHRAGTSGVDRVLTLFSSPKGGYGLGACKGRIYGDGGEAVAVDTATPTAVGLELTWLDSMCGSATLPDHVLDRVDVSESTTQVGISVIVRQNPAVPSPPAGAACNLVAHATQTSVSLKQPVGDRQLMNEGFVPPRPISVAR